MKYITTLVWGFILGQVAFYIGSALGGNGYDFIQASILGIVVAVVVSAIAALLPKNQQQEA